MSFGGTYFGFDPHGTPFQEGVKIDQREGEGYVVLGSASWGLPLLLRSLGLMPHCLRRNSRTFLMNTPSPWGGGVYSDTKVLSSE